MGKNNKIYPIQIEFDTYVKAVLEYVVGTILRDLARGNEHKLSIVYLADLLEEPSCDDFYCDMDATMVRSGKNRIYLKDEGLAKALKRLNRKNREIIVLYYFVGLRPEEIADIVELNVDAVYNRKSRSIKRLKKFILEDRNAEGL